MNAIIYFVKSYLLSDRYRYDPEIYWTMDAYKRDLFWNLKAICHSKGSISEPVDVRLNVDNINLTLATQERLQSNTDLDELRILEVCVNPILTSNYKHFPYYSQNTIISDKRNYSSIGDLNSLRKFSDASFDAVVVTLMLCNSRDIDNHIQHIYRILVQGGHIYFLEHEPNCSDSPNDGNIDKSVLSFTSFGTLNSFFTWLRPPAKSQNIVAALQRNRFLNCDVLQNLYFPDTYPERRFVLGFAIK